MSSNRKVKGYIFKRHNDTYYGLYRTFDRSEATVYSMEKIKSNMQQLTYWGRKDLGKWIIVYE